MAMSLSYVLFALLAAPTGLFFSRRGVSAAFLMTAGYAVLYYLLELNIFKELAYGGAIDPAVGAWAAYRGDIISPATIRGISSKGSNGFLATATLQSLCCRAGDRRISSVLNINVCRTGA